VFFLRESRACFLKTPKRKIGRFVPTNNMERDKSGATVARIVWSQLIKGFLLYLHWRWEPLFLHRGVKIAFRTFTVVGSQLHGTASVPRPVISAAETVHVRANLSPPTRRITASGLSPGHILSAVKYEPVARTLATTTRVPPHQPTFTGSPVR